MTDIVGLKGTKGGKHIVDRFEVQATQVVERLVAAYNKTGHGALALRKQNTAVMLVPPLKLSFRSQRREPDDARVMPTELLLQGHFVMLVDRKAMGKNPLWKFDEERAMYSKEVKLAYKIAVAAAMRERPDVVPKHILKFLRIL